MAILGGCGASHRAVAPAARAPAPPAAASDAKPLRLSALKIPRLDVPHYRTHGAFPQVASPKPRLRRVNAALLEVLHRDQRRYARRARKRVRQIDRDIRRYHGRWLYKGVYMTTPEPRLSSASSDVVSVLVPTRALFPGGNDGDYWLFATVRVATGQRIAISDLFARPPEALRALAKDVAPRLARENACVRKDTRASPYFRHRFRPSAHRYRKFALTPTGLAIAFDLAEVVSPPCGRVETIVPYDVVRPYLNAVGRELVAGVRRPL
jgi:hypothetical protein